MTKKKFLITFLNDRQLNNSSTIKYNSKLINTYFSGYNIDFKQNKSRNCKYKISKKFNEMKAFCKEYI